MPPCWAPSARSDTCAHSRLRSPLPVTVSLGHSHPFLWPAAAARAAATAAAWAAAAAMGPPAQGPSLFARRILNLNGPQPASHAGWPASVTVITVFQNPVPNSKRGAVIRSKVGGSSFQSNYRPPSRGDSRGVAVAPIGAAGYNPGLWTDLPTIIRAPPASPTVSAVRQHSTDVLGPAARRRA